MNDLMDLADIAELFRCSRRHARDVIVKAVQFPEIAPGSTPRNPLWLRVEVRSFLHRKSHTSRKNPAQEAMAARG